MIIDQTTTITITLGEVISSVNCVFEASWLQHVTDGTTVTAFIPGSAAGTTNGTTPVTAIGSPPSNAFRQLDSLTIYNGDNINHTVYVRRGSENLIAAMLVPGASLQYAKSGGWLIFSNVGGSFTIQQYTSGSGTWTKPSLMKYAFVCCVGAGGGGGGGRRAAAGVNRFGGGGGGGGAMTWQLLAADSLSSTVAYSVGAGGSAGSSASTDDTNGGDGGNGSDTSFGGFVVATAGSGGLGGKVTTGSGGAGGSLVTCVPNYGPYALGGGAGANGVTTAASTGTNGLTGTAAAPGGAGGRGISNANASGTGAVTGGGVYNNGSLVSGSSVSTNGLDDQARSLLFSPSLVGLYGIGTGAGGGDVAGDGGDGGNHGAGGGGGGASLNGTASGAGGVGGSGLITIAEFY